MANAEPEVLNNTKVLPTVELQLTKSDLVDMVVAEQEELVEERIDVLDEQLAAAKETFKSLLEKASESVIKNCKKSCSKEVRAAEKFIGAEAVYEISTHGVKETRGQAFEYQVYDSKRRKQKKQVNLPELVLPHHLKVKVKSVNFENNRYSNSNLDGTSGAWYFRRTLTQDDLQVPEYPKLLEAHSNLVELIKERARMDAAMSNIETMGQRAKARMVRQVLAGSKQGQQLLKAIPKIDSAKLLGVGKTK